jgi:hypothetical protein
MRLVSLNEFSRRDPDHSFEMAREVTLVDESQFKSHTGNAIAFQEKLPGLPDSDLNQVFMGRNPYVPKKQAMKMKGTQTGYTRQFLQGRIIPETRLDEVADAFDSTAL